MAVPGPDHGWHFWVDRGGTFTDLIGCDPEGRLHVRKVLSERSGHDPAVAAMCDCLGLGADAGLPEQLVDSVRLGTTVATNALLEGRGTPLLLITNSGLADLLRIGDQHREDLFAFVQASPPFLATTVVEVPGRMTPSGSELEPLHVSPDLRQQLIALRASGLRHAVVALLHAHRNPDHERACALVLSELGFEQVTCSHQVSALPRLVPRGQTALAEGAVAPVLHGYLDQVKQALGASTPLRVMTSSGSLQDPSALLAKDTILSGPAAGMVGAIAAARSAGLTDVPVIGFDMGGTSTDVFCVPTAETSALHQLQETTAIAGLQLLAPRLSIDTVAAGGGSVLHRVGDRLQVGPRSAGARPGPACYRAGGPLTITDANLLLGRLQLDRFPSVFGPNGDQAPDLGVVQEAFASLAKGFGQSSEQLAEGALQLAIERMADAIRRVSLHRGQDIRGGVLVAYGGAGGQHACRLAEELGLDSVLLHPMAGVLSAYGMGQACQRRRLQQHWGQPLTIELLADLPQQVKSLHLQARHQLEQQGDASDGAVLQVALDLRYAGADQTLTLPWSEHLQISELIAAFQAMHQQRFGYCIAADDRLVLETLTVELTAAQQFQPTAATAVNVADRPTPPRRLVDLHLRGQGWSQVPLFDRESLRCEQRVQGPALIAEATGCIVLEPGWVARITAEASLLLQRDATPDQADSAIDPGAVRGELFRHRFMAIAEQMGERLRLSSRSVNIRERLDFSCALFDRQGALVANAPHIPVHLGSMGDSVRDLLAQVQAGAIDPLQPGDTLLSNDPFHGGTHLPDITAITPVFCGDREPSFFVASRGHHADVGGISPGSMPSFSRCIEEEGLLVRNLLFVRQGEIQARRWQAACDAVPIPPRNPQELVADLQAQVAANQAGVEGLLRLVEREGVVCVQQQMVGLQSHASRCVRRMLEQLSDGDRELHLDDGATLAVQVRVQRDQQRLQLDFSHSSCQQGSNLNAPLAVTRACVLYVIRCLLEDDIPLNEGCFEPLDLIVPEGSMLNPTAPAAVVAGNVEVSQALCNLLFGALDVQAAGQGTMNNLSFGDGRRQYYETIAGGGGAGPGFHGSVGLQSQMTNSRLTDPEVLEQRYPVRVERFSRRIASGGPGRWCGGDGLERTLRFLEPMRLSLISGSRRVPPFGLNGGGDGACGVNTVLRADGTEQPLPGSAQLDLAAGDAIHLQTPGGGGYGELTD
ncbi:hydantoinase B/oxoprolinase family protein [Parasynechococcus sp.]|uniref:hydantoinase B/oxoprolinase family protein n=1 Tax=Parasynechococcus sp. TaxID=3101203 RepID=UPI003703DF69